MFAVAPPATPPPVRPPPPAGGGSSSSASATKYVRPQQLNPVLAAKPAAAAAAAGSAVSTTTTTTSSSPSAASPVAAAGSTPMTTDSKAQQKRSKSGDKKKPKKGDEADGPEDGAVIGAAPSSRHPIEKKGINASPLHDIELYQSVLQLLPNSPIADSVLFSGVGGVVLDEVATPEEQLKIMEEKIQKWRMQQKAKLDEMYEQKLKDETFENSVAFNKAQTEDSKREAKINDLLLRLESLESAVKKDVDKVVSRVRGGGGGEGGAVNNASLVSNNADGNSSIFGTAVTAPDGGPPEGSYFRKEWELLQIKHKESSAEAQMEVDRIKAKDDEKKTASLALAFASEFAKVGINEQLTRCGLYSEQEHERFIVLSRRFAEGRERISALEDAREYMTKHVVASEAAARAKIMSKFPDLVKGC